MFIAVGGCRHTGTQQHAAPASSSSAERPPAERADAAVPSRIDYVIAASESRLTFVVKDSIRSHSGAFRNFSGKISVPNGRASEATVEVDIDLASLMTDDEQLTKLLKSSEVFDVRRYPWARFRSTSVTSGGPLGATNTVHGDLELHGLTRAIAIPGTVHVRAADVYVDAEFSLQRRDFGLRLPGKREALVEDAVTLSLVVVAEPVH